MASIVICEPSGKSLLSEGTVLVLAPTGRDAEGATLLLGKAGINCRAYASFQLLYEALDEKTGAILIAEEAIRDTSLHHLLEWLEAQPVWSDLPVIVLTRASSSGSISSRSPLSRLSEVIGNVMFLERPLHGLTLVSAVRTALKARRRQYQSRDYLVEREQAAEALLEYQRKLEQSNRELEQFAMIASHDLQAPLRKVEMFADLLEKNSDHALSADSVDYIARMKKSVHRMQLLISDLLSLSRITRQGRPFRKIDLSEVIHEALDDLVEARQKVDGRIELNIQDATGVFGDQDQLRQIFQNLVENALKFHRVDVPPVVRISTKAVPTGCQITIEDNGIGFNETYSDRIFETFQRLHGQNEYPGTGIGLSIVRKIIERHGGQVSVTSVIGEGSCFVINLPVQAEI